MRALFARLTRASPKRGAGLFGAAVDEARRVHWFAQGGVPDTVEGRFAVLATVLALVLVRLERGPAGEAASVAVTERFIEAMDAEVRQMGVGDPTVGKQVRALVGALSTRVEHWRDAVSDEARWERAVQRSLYRDENVDDRALASGVTATRALWDRLSGLTVDAIAEGRIA